MKCPKCTAPNPDGKHFCGECGASLDSVSEEFRRNVLLVFREQLKDQKLVEIETTDAVLSRLKTMAKPFLYTLAALAALLGVLGIRSTQDIMRGVAAARETAVQTLRQQASTETQSLSQEAATIREQYRKLGDQQDLIAKLKQAQADLQTIQQAGKSLKARYEQLGTEMAATTTDASATRPAASTSVSGDVSMSLGGNRQPVKPTANRIYALGSRGDEVQQIQRRLSDLGCYAGEVNGAFDEKTKQAVERFNQRPGGLGIGVVDEYTWKALIQSRNPPRCGPPSGA
jgi:murein L,D-transpeptidase YcbB/YkuD